MPPGTYYGSVAVRVGSLDKQLPVYFTVRPAATVLSLEFSGTTFTARAGNGNTLTQNIAVNNVGLGNLDWRTEVQSGGDWLVLVSGSGTSRPGSPSNFAVGVNPRFASDAGNSGAYSAVVKIYDSANPGNFQLFTAQLNVTKSDITPAEPILSPVGLVFTTVQGTTTPARSFQVFTSSQTQVEFQAGAQTNTGAAWLRVTPGRGVTSTNLPATVSATVSTEDLPPGTYRGGVTVSIGNKLRVVGVTLVVLPRPASRQVSSSHLDTCVASVLEPTVIDGLPGNFNVTQSSLVPLRVQVTDDCGRSIPLPNTPDSAPAVVTIGFDKGTPAAHSMDLDPVTGYYTYLWTPDTEAPVTTLTVRAKSKELKLSGSASAGTDGAAISGLTQTTGAVTKTDLPALPDSNIQDFNNPAASAPLAPGSIIRLTGANLADKSQTTSVCPANITLGCTKVRLGDEYIPLLSVSPTSIVAQIPADLKPANWVT